MPAPVASPEKIRSPATAAGEPAAAYGLRSSRCGAHVCSSSVDPVRQLRRSRRRAGWNFWRSASEIGAEPAFFAAAC